MPSGPTKGPGADSGEKHEPASDIDTAVVDSLKALDLKRPIREADMARTLPEGCSCPERTVFLCCCVNIGRWVSWARAGQAPRPPLPGTASARARWRTLAYVEKVRPRFLSLRQQVI